MEQIGLLLPMVTPWTKPEYFSRLWCIFEFWMAHRHQTEIELLFRPGEATELKGALEWEGGKSVTETMMSGVDCASASASFAEDERWIRHAISHNLGFDTLDLLIRERFQRMVLEIQDEEIPSWHHSPGSLPQPDRWGKWPRLAPIGVSKDIATVPMPSTHEDVSPMGVSVWHP